MIASFRRTINSSKKACALGIADAGDLPGDLDWGDLTEVQIRAQARRGVMAWVVAQLSVAGEISLYKALKRSSLVSVELSDVNLDLCCLIEPKQFENARVVVQVSASCGHDLRSMGVEQRVLPWMHADKYIVLSDECADAREVRGEELVSQEAVGRMRRQRNQIRSDARKEGIMATFQCKMRSRHARFPATVWRNRSHDRLARRKVRLGRQSSERLIQGYLRRTASLEIQDSFSTPFHACTIARAA